MRTRWWGLRAYSVLNPHCTTLES